MKTVNVVLTTLPGGSGWQYPRHGYSVISAIPASFGVRLNRRPATPRPVRRGVAPMNAKLSLADLVELLSHPDSGPESGPDSWSELLIVHPARSDTLAPCFMLNADRLQPGADAGLMFQGVAEFLLHKRQRRYASRLAASWDGPRLVACGDSWFHFPILCDLVHQLDRDHAVHCLSGVGNLLHNLVRQNDLRDAIVEQKPDAVILSAGGGELFSAARIRAFVSRFDAARPPAEHLTGYFGQFLVHELIPRMKGLLQSLLSVDSRLPILIHSYAYAIPRNHIWLGHPLRALGIVEPMFQRQIIAALVDRFHEELVALLRQPEFARVHLVDCRDAIGPHWFDELHPNNRGFELMADRFRATLSRLL